MEHVSLIGSALAIITSLTAMVRYLLKLNWKLKREADVAKSTLLQRQLNDLDESIASLKTQMSSVSKKIEDFGHRLDSNRDAADAVLASLRAFVNTVNVKFNEIDEKFGKIIFKP